MLWSLAKWFNSYECAASNHNHVDHKTWIECDRVDLWENEHMNILFGRNPFEPKLHFVLLNNWTMDNKKNENK